MTGQGEAGVRRVGVVGAGRAFERLYGPALRRMRQLELVAVADPRPIAGGGLRRWLSLEAMLREEALGGLSVLSPPDLHGEHVLAGLEAGLPVLVEKPPAVSVAEVDRWRSAGGGRVAAAFSRRGWEAYRRGLAGPGHRWEFELETNEEEWGATTREPLERNLLSHAIDLAEWLSGERIAGVEGLRRDEASLAGVFTLERGGSFAWRVAYGARYRERLAIDGRERVRRPGRRLLPVGRPGPPEDVVGVARALEAWAALLAGDSDGDGLLGDLAAARRHVELLEAIERAARGEGP
jgi:predicted dehydrogenase